MYIRFRLLSHGTLISLTNDTTDYMLVEINNDIIILKIKIDEYLNEVSIKFEEIDSSWIHIEIGQHKNTWFIDVNGEKHILIIPADLPIKLCTNNLLIGNLEVNAYCT